jgi:hypothetical protein
LKIETQIWTLSIADRTDANRNTDFRQINYVQTDIHRLTKLSHKYLMLLTSDFLGSKGDLVFNPGLITAPAERTV